MKEWKDGWYLSESWMTRIGVGCCQNQDFQEGLGIELALK